MAQIKKIDERVRRKVVKLQQQDGKSFDPYKIIKHPLTTEKSIRMLESDNKLVFIVDRSASKPQIKKAVEAAFQVKVVKVSTLIRPDGQKKAYVRLSDATPAMEVATKLELM